MASLRIISSPAPSPDMLEALKQYASVPDSGRDALLTGLLTTAYLRVQEYADRALMPCVCEQTSAIGDDRIVRLYLGGGTVQSVKTPAGADIAFEPYGRAKLQLYTGVSEVVVTFSTIPDMADVNRCQATVLRYATALYDGAPTEELNTILNEVLC